MERHGNNRKNTLDWKAAHPPHDYSASWLSSLFVKILELLGTKEDKKIGSGIPPLHHPDGGRTGD